MEFGKVIKKNTIIALKFRMVTYKILFVMSLHQKGGGHIDFGADFIVVGVSVTRSS